MKRSRIILTVVVVLLVVGGVIGWQTWRKIFGPGPSFPQDRVVLIPSGSSFTQVTDSLMAAGVITDVEWFSRLAEQKNYTVRIRPGRYVISSATSMNDLVNKLRSGEQDPVRVTFTNIQRTEQLAGQVAKYLECDSLALLKTMTDPAVIEGYGFRPETMISMFIPNTYEFWWTTTPTKFLDRMAEEYRRFWTDARKQKAQALGMKQSEVSTLASIVQAETARADEAPLIASVYLNRLRINMPLQADPTLKFAMGLDTIQRLLATDLSIDSPYNTYKHIGLPPGPINLPEPRFIDAVLNAEDSDYLYFCAREDLSGYSNFAKNYEQHQVNARRYQRALNQRGIFR